MTSLFMEPLLWKDVLSAALIASGNSIHWLLLNDHDKNARNLRICASASASLKPRVLRSGFLQDGDVPNNP